MNGVPDLEYCRKGERCGTRHGRLVLSITRPCSVSSAAATCASTYSLVPEFSI